MKLLGISSNNQMVRLGESPNVGSWYFLDKNLDIKVDSVSKTIISGSKTYKINDEIEFRFEKRAGSNYIVNISTEAKTNSEKPVSTESNTKSETKTNQKEEIKKDSTNTEEKSKDSKKHEYDPNLSMKQTCAHVAGRLVNACAGLVSLESVGEEYNKLFKTVYKSIKEN